MRENWRYIRLAAIALLALFIVGTVWKAFSTKKYVERGGVRMAISGSELPALATGETKVIYRSTLLRGFASSGNVLFPSVPADIQLNCTVFADGTTVPLTVGNVAEKVEIKFQLPTGAKEVVFQFIKTGGETDLRILDIYCRANSVGGIALLVLALIAIVVLILPISVKLEEVNEESPAVPQ